MVEVGVRELKARLSYYLQLAQAGEVIAVKVRHRVVSFLSKIRPAAVKQAGKTRQRNADTFMQRLKQAGRIVSAKRCHLRPFTPVRMTPGPSTTEMIRQMRDEEWE